MAIITFDPPIGPTPGTAHKPQVSLWEAEFGDGYSQPTPKGLNHIRRTVSLKWDALTLDQMQELAEFFERMVSAARRAPPGEVDVQGLVLSAGIGRRLDVHCRTGPELQQRRVADRPVVTQGRPRSRLHASAGSRGRPEAGARW